MTDESMGICWILITGIITLVVIFAILLLCDPPKEKHRAEKQSRYMRQILQAEAELKAKHLKYRCRCCGGSDECEVCKVSSQNKTLLKLCCSYCGHLVDSTIIETEN